MKTLSIAIGGMSCGHCVAAVRNALAGVPGVRVEGVSVGAATVRYDEAQATPDQIAEALREEGYEPHDLRS